MVTWIRTAVIVCAVAAASHADDSPGPDPCADAPTAFVELPCRDGARCDLDRTCDGWCIVQPYYRTSSRRHERNGYRYPCYFDVRRVAPRKNPRSWTPLGTHFLRGGDGVRDSLEATTFRVRCRPARKSCPLLPVTANVAISGAHQASFATRRHAVVDTSSTFRIFLDDAEPPAEGAEQGLWIFLDGPLAPGTYRASYIELRFRDVGGQPRLFSTFTPQCPAAGPCGVGSFDGEVEIAAVESSETPVHVVYGALHGTFSQGPETITVDAAF